MEENEHISLTDAVVKNHITPLSVEPRYQISLSFSSLLYSQLTPEISLMPILTALKPQTNKQLTDKLRHFHLYDLKMKSQFKLK